MIREVVHDPILLGMKSKPATKEDLQVAQNLLDTLIANKDACVGMAANMIGLCKRIIVFDNQGTYMTMFNPEIIKMSGPYDTEEGCLSLASRRCLEAKRRNRLSLSSLSNACFSSFTLSSSNWSL